MGFRKRRRRREKVNVVAMFFVYFLKSLKNHDLYIGSTEDVGKRLNRHNAGKIRSTQFNKPWQLLDYEVYNTRGEAVQRERFLKTGQQKELLKNKYKNK